MTTDRIPRAQERLRIAARLYQLGAQEPSDGLAKTAMPLCDGARWADGCGEVAYDAWMGGAS